MLRQRNVLADLQAEYQPLAAQFGAIPVVDPEKYLVTRVETDDPMHFLWRVYYPAGVKVIERDGSGGSSSSGSTSYSQAVERFYRCRLELDEAYLYVHTLDRGGGSKMSVGSSEMATFVQERWDELDIEALEGTVELATDRVLPFLRVRVPENLWNEFEQTVGAGQVKRYRDHCLFQSLRGTKEAFENYDLEPANLIHE